MASSLNRKRMSLPSLVLVASLLIQATQAVYYYAQAGKWKCFQDIVAKNNVSHSLHLFSFILLNMPSWHTDTYWGLIINAVFQTLEMEVIVLDKDVLEAIVQANDDLRDRGKTANQGIRLMLTDKDDKQLFYGDVHPNVQYEYDTTDAGEYKLCVMLTEMAFRNK